MQFGGPVLVAQFKSIGEFRDSDPATGQARVSRSFRVHVPYPDGTIIPETIYFPREAYNPPQLKADAFYSFPVIIRPKRNDPGKLSYTARADVVPFAAPAQS